MEGPDIGRAEYPLGVRLPSLAQPLCDGVPLAKILIDQPLDQLADTPFDLSRCIGDDPIFEFLLDASTIEQIEHAPDAQGVFEERVPACLHFDQHLLDLRHPQLEAALQVAPVDGQLPLDVLEQGKVLA